MTVSLKRLTLDSVLSRLDVTEKHVSVLSSSTSHGWQPTVAWNPVQVFEIDSRQTIIQTSELISFVNEQHKLGRLLVGYLSYDLGARLHNVELTTDDDLKTPLAYIHSFDNWITFDDYGSTVNASMSSFIKEVSQIMSRPSSPVPARLFDKKLFPTWSRTSYNTAYKNVQRYITAGDIYQANLTHRLEGVAHASGISIFRKINRTSNADFQSYIDGGNFEIISASPERFVLIRDGTIITTPIKGTRARGANQAEDESLRSDLASNPKDKAELDMITDLMRNDLGRISQIGSVEVIERRLLMAYPTLWHAHSEIHGKLLKDSHPIEALLSLMPGGSITGCPKKRAMEIIDEVEEKRRGVYTGSIFIIKPDGELDASIAIRTIVKKQDNVYLSVGGGIVYDSKQVSEYEETLQKAASFLKL
jgi:para-aminobenzoate synthetase component 1